LKNQPIIQLIFPCIIFFVLSGELKGQDSYDTLKQAQYLSEQRGTKEALALLSGYHQDHPKDLYTNWIYAQTAYKAGNFRLSKELYLAAIEISPDNAGLQLEFAKSLLSRGDIDKAGEYIKHCTALDGNNPEPWYYLASIDYWKGDYNKALTLVNNLLIHVPDYKPASKLKDEILVQQSPWLSLDGNYSSDDQPMNMLNPVLKGGWSRSNLLGPDFEFRVPVSFQDSGNFTGIGFNAGNNFYFRKSDLRLYLNAGLFNHTSLGTVGWTADLKLTKILLNKMLLWAEFQRNPYLMTLSSLKIPLFENDLRIGFTWNDPDRWNGQVSVVNSTFSTDNNNVVAIGGWVLAPKINAGRFGFQFGYGYAYSTSAENRFVPEKTLSEIISNWNDSTSVKGIYNPYFTPNDQNVHSVIALINFRAAKSVNISLKINGGVYATAMYPYLYLDQNADDSLFIDRQYIHRTFHPLDISAGFTWQITNQWDLSAELIYNSTIYYTTKIAGITLRKRL
jgi:tetratricopeptide (TPR) repeat protein